MSQQNTQEHPPHEKSLASETRLQFDYYLTVWSVNISLFMSLLDIFLSCCWSVFLLLSFTWRLSVSSLHTAADKAVSPPLSFHLSILNFFSHAEESGLVCLLSYVSVSALSTCLLDWIRLYWSHNGLSAKTQRGRIYFLIVLLFWMAWWCLNFKLYSVIIDTTI